MTPSERKAAISAYKERKPAYGVYAVICNATGEAWVGHSRHVDTQKNGLWFALRQGGSPHKSLQAAWNRHGPEEFRFEELERLGEDYSPAGGLHEIKKRQALWGERLQATRL
jgi:hypothetical protein